MIYYSAQTILRYYSDIILFILQSQSITMNLSQNLNKNFHISLNTPIPIFETIILKSKIKLYLNSTNLSLYYLYIASKRYLSDTFLYLSTILYTSSHINDKFLSSKFHVSSKSDTLNFSRPNCDIASSTLV